MGAFYEKAYSFWTDWVRSDEQQQGGLLPSQLRSLRYLNMFVEAASALSRRRTVALTIYIDRYDAKALQSPCVVLLCFLCDKLEELQVEGFGGFADGSEEQIFCFLMTNDVTCAGAGAGAGEAPVAPVTGAQCPSSRQVNAAKSLEMLFFLWPVKTSARRRKPNHSSIKIWIMFLWGVKIDWSLWLFLICVDWTTYVGFFLFVLILVL